MKVVGKKFIRYENDNNKLHNEKGPALIQFKEDGNEYNEWWSNGKLLAVFDSGVFKKTDFNSFTSLEEVVVPPKWKGLEGTLSLSDIQLLSKQLTNEVIPEITDGYRANYNEKLETTKKIQSSIDGIVFRNELSNGKLHKSDGPALRVPDSNYSEWWDKGRLVATLKDGELKRSVDGTFSGLKNVEIPKKWKDLEGTLSLNDLELCRFKPEIIEMSNTENKISPQKLEIQTKISTLRKELIDEGIKPDAYVMRK